MLIRRQKKKIHNVTGDNKKCFEAASVVTATLHTVGGMSEEWFEAASVVAAKKVYIHSGGDK